MRWYADSPRRRPAGAADAARHAGGQPGAAGRGPARPAHAQPDRAGAGLPRPGGAARSRGRSTTAAPASSGGGAAWATRGSTRSPSRSPASRTPSRRCGRPRRPGAGGRLDDVRRAAARRHAAALPGAAGRGAALRAGAAAACRWPTTATPCPPTRASPSWRRTALLAVLRALPPGVRPVVLADRGFARAPCLAWLRRHGAALRRPRHQGHLPDRGRRPPLEARPARPGARRASAGTRGCATACTTAARAT